jgi:2-keto-3-deoxy-L-rhamnonate aldolase RhmA
MRETRIVCWAAVCASLMIALPEAQQGGGQSSPSAASSAPSQPEGWAVRASRQGSIPLYNKAKQKLLDGKQIFSYTISRRDPDLYCQVAQHYDFIWMEMQHSTMTWGDIADMIAACPRVGVPMIRRPDEFESTIQKATDIGALGMIEPTVDTVEKAMAVVRYSKYPQEGRRSMGAGQAPTIWGVNGINYRQTINENMLVVVMIETPVGVANATEIARTPGVDVVLAANTDLGNFSGYQPNEAGYQELVTKIHDATLKAGKFLGATNASYASAGPAGRTDSADFRMFQNGPAPDGYQPPGRSGRSGSDGAPAGGGRQGRGRGAH